MDRAEKAEAVYKALTERRWKIIDPDPTDPTAWVVTVLSDSQILAKYWDWWSMQMRQGNRDESEITEQECIIDFVVTNWATQVE